MVEEKTVLTLDRYEIGIILRVLNDKRTDIIKEKKDPDVVERVMKKVLLAPTKKQRFHKHEKSL